MTENDDPSPKGRSFIMGWIRKFGFAKAIVVALFAVVITVLEFPGKINDFLAELPLARERWVEAHQWTGMYSSLPEGVTNMEDLELSSESDVVLNLNYSKERHDIDGYIYSETFLGGGRFHPTLMLYGTPSILWPNSLKLKVFDVVRGQLSDIDELRIKRDGPDGIVTVSSNGPLLRHTLRLSPDEHLTEDDLDFRSLLERARDNIRDSDTSATD